jgi:cell division transport system permease protein
MNATTSTPKRGATTAKATWRHRFDRYRQHHRAVALDSLRRLVRAPLSTLMTWLVIAIALSLPAGLFVLLKNAQTVSEGWEGGAQISLYLQQSVSDKDARALVDEVAARVDVKRVDFISREKALADFQRQSGLGDILAGLDENPLPAVLVVYPDQADFAAADKLRSDLAKKEGVETAQLDAQWVQRLYAMLDLGERLVIALAAALALAVMLVIVNTIHLAIQSRRDEILIVKLVGATDAYVRRPFLYTGFWYGLGGSLLALALVSAVLSWLDGPVTTLATLYHSNFRLTGLGVGPALLLVLIAVLIGLSGAALAVRQHLREYEPR